MNRDCAVDAHRGGPERALLIDVGNSRLKWAVLGRAGLGTQHADPYQGWGAIQLRARVLLPAGRFDRVLVASVASPRIMELIRGTVRELRGIEPEFLESSAEAGGVRNGYRDPVQLGVDRWAALIGARSLENGACCIVDVGTAATIDGLSSAGQHLGGLIIPGPDMMFTSLMHGTSEIAARASAGQLVDAFFADNTLAAVYQGAVHALAALVDRAVAAMHSQSGEQPVVLLTGGASDRVRHLLGPGARVVPDLVLRGLAVLVAPARSVAVQRT